MVQAENHHGGATSIPRCPELVALISARLRARLAFIYRAPRQAEGGWAWPGPHRGRAGAGAEPALRMPRVAGCGPRLPRRRTGRAPTKCPVGDPAACACAAAPSLYSTSQWNAAGKSIRVGPAPAGPAPKVGSFLRFVHRHQGSFLQPVPSPSTCLRRALQMSLALSLRSCFSTSCLPALKADCFSSTKWF